MPSLNQTSQPFEFEATIDVCADDGDNASGDSDGDTARKPLGKGPLSPEEYTHAPTHLEDPARLRDAERPTDKSLLIPPLQPTNATLRTAAADYSDMSLDRLDRRAVNKFPAQPLKPKNLVSAYPPPVPRSAEDADDDDDDIENAAADDGGDYSGTRRALVDGDEGGKRGRSDPTTTETQRLPDSLDEACAEPFASRPRSRGPPLSWTRLQSNSAQPFAELDNAFAPMSESVMADYHACIKLKTVSEYAADALNVLSHTYNGERAALDELSRARHEMRWASEKKRKVAAVLRETYEQVETILAEQMPTSTN